jgi:hypothetical protein
MLTRNEFRNDPLSAADRESGVEWRSGKGGAGLIRQKGVHKTGQIPLLDCENGGQRPGRLVHSCSKRLPLYPIINLLTGLNVYQITNCIPSGRRCNSGARTLLTCAGRWAKVHSLSANSMFEGCRNIPHALDGEERISVSLGRLWNLHGQQRIDATLTPAMAFLARAYSIE